MSIKKIVGFGDSWMFGSDIVEPTLLEETLAQGLERQDAEFGQRYHRNVEYREAHCYLTLLGQQLDCEVENYSEAGNSIPGMRYNFLEWIKDKGGLYSGVDELRETLVIFGVTESSRFSFFDNKEKYWRHSSWAHGVTNLEEIWKLHLVTSDCDELHNWTVLDFTLTTKHICESLGIRYIYTPVFRFNPETTRHRAGETILIDNPNCYRWTQNEIMTIEAMNGHKVWYEPNTGHPNELGHKLIAKHLINFMKERKLI